MEDILTKYEDISQYTCVVCGKINVPIFDDGWISPFCRECYKSHRERVWGNNLTDEKIESLITENPNLTRDTIVEISNSNGTVNRRIDFSDTLRVLGVNPDSLPTIEKILEARKEREEHLIAVWCRFQQLSEFKIISVGDRKMQIGMH